MRIAYFVLHYPQPDEPAGYFWGGSGEAAAGLAEAMASIGHDVVVFASSPDHHRRIRRINGVTIVECPSRLTVSQAKIAPSVLYEGLAFAFDVIHAHVASPPADFAALLYARLRHVPLVITYHGDPQAHYGGLIRRLLLVTYQNLFLPYLLNSADLLYVPSLPFSEESSVLSGLGRPVKELPNGVRTEIGDREWTKQEARERLGVPSSAGVALYLGSLSPYKGPEILIESANLIKASSRGVRIIFVGDGVLRDSLSRQVKTLQLTTMVQFEGYVPKAKKGIYLAAADVFVLPSTMTQEVFPIAILEAFAAGLPVIVSNLKTFRRFVEPDVNGLVVQAGDPSALAESILRLLGDHELRVRLGSNARLAAARYDWRRIAKQAERDYLGLTSRTGKNLREDH